MPERRAVVPLPVALRPWVAEISLSSHHGEPQTLTEIPDPAVTLALRPFSADPGDVMVAGPRTHAIHYTAEPGRSCLQLRMRPGWAPPALPPVREMVDRLVPLGDDAGALLDIPVGRERPNHVPNELVENAARLLAAGATVRSVAHALDVSERHLRNLFNQKTGLSPKRFARIQRVRSVSTGLGHQSLARLAVTAGYYDQAHMTTEFRRLMGITPAAFAAGQRPQSAPCHHRPADR